MPLNAKDLTVEPFYTTCDKCGRPVERENNALELEAMLRSDLLMIFSQPRHLLPTEDCPGSPSRAQYIEGQPRDTRGTYPYNEDAEPLIREAYARLLNNDDPWWES